jgi:hypothetical protein
VRPYRQLWSCRQHAIPKDRTHLCHRSPITAILGHRPTDTDLPTSVTDSERQGLLAALSTVPDPRDSRGIRYPLASMLATAVCAVIAGACTFAAMADWVHDLDPPAWANLGFTDRLPAPSTLWRVLTRVDDTELSVIVTRWVRARTASARASGRRWRRMIAIDGKVLRGAKLPDGRQVHLLSAFDTSTGTVLAYVQIAVKSNEILAFTPCWTWSRPSWARWRASCSSRTHSTPRPSTCRQDTSRRRDRVLPNPRGLCLRRAGMLR